MAELLIHFISDFLRDKDLRCAVLKNELKGPLDYGLSLPQVDILHSYDPDLILCAAYNEVLAAGVDVIRKKLEIGGDHNPPSSQPKDCEALQEPCDEGDGAERTRAALAMMAHSAYQAGGIHGRKIQPPGIPAGEERAVTILGNGFETSTVEVRFRKQTDTVQASVEATTCDIDLYQRLRVKVKLSSGTWRAEFRNTSQESWAEGDRPLDLVVG